jgi:Flp pilus assembly pilin Flp
MRSTSPETPVEPCAPGAPETAPASSDAPAGLAANERGVVMVEYVTLLCLVTLTGAAAVVALGVPLMQLFRYVQMVIAMPIP